MSRISWHTDFENLASLDAWQKKIARDVGYRKLSFHAQDLFSQGSIEDEMLVALT